jgi:hypothetical protein
MFKKEIERERGREGRRGKDKGIEPFLSRNVIF